MIMMKTSDEMQRRSFKIIFALYLIDISRLLNLLTD